MDIFEAIKHRRSVYPNQFKNTSVEDSTIEKLLELANWAPTHRKTEPWRFKVMKGDFKQKAGEFFKDTYLKITEKPKTFKANKIPEKFKQSSHVIAVCMQRDPKESVPEWEEIAATAMAVQNMWIAARDLNLGMYWSTPVYKDYLKEIVPLNEGETCLGFLYLGYFDESQNLLERQSEISKKTNWYTQN
jgi:nitroreductase